MKSKNFTRPARKKVNRVPRDQAAIDREEHRQRHIVLHNMLNELIADFIAQTGKLPSKTTIPDLARWSNEQTIHPTETSQ